MNIDINQLSQDVGLKFNDNVILGKQKVAEYIIDNQEKFANLDLEPIEESQMLYGFNSNQNPIKIGYEEGLIQRIIIITEPINYTRYKAEISYDGHQYNGFQIQDNQKTIQGELTKIISKINGYETLVQGSSRTDTGVHANNFVIHYDSLRKITQKKWLELLNHQLPNDILVRSLFKTHPIFHSRYDVYKKRYIYKIKLNDIDPFRINYEWNCRDLNVDIMQKNIGQLIGTHDFTSFCKGKPKDPIRTIYEAKIKQDGDYIELIFEGNGFLRYMIRIIVNALVLQASNKLNISIEDIIKEKSRLHTKNLAPASGLYLDKIFY